MSTPSLTRDLPKVPRPVAHGINDAIRTLDDIGFDVGNYHLSVWTAVKVVIVALVVIVVARLVTSFVKRGFARMTLDSTQRVLADKFTGIVVWTIAILVGIDALGINLTALTVFSGAVGLAVGFGLQKAFGNLIAGIILLIDRSIKPGDVIAVNDGKGQTFGEVRKIGFRAVSIATRDNREFLIPNENLMTGTVENWSYSSRQVGISIPIGIAYGCDVELAEKLLLEAANTTRRVLAKPAPGVLLTGFGASSIDLQLGIWVNDPEEGLGNVRSEILKRAWRLFRDNGIEVPFPQQDLRLRDSEGLRLLVDALGERTVTVSGDVPPRPDGVKAPG